MQSKIEIEIPEGMPEPTAAIHNLIRAEEIVEQQWDAMLDLLRNGETWEELYAAVNQEFRPVRDAIGAAKELFWAYKKAMTVQAAEHGARCCEGCAHWDGQTITCTRPQGAHNGEATEPWQVCTEFEYPGEVSQ